MFLASNKISRFHELGALCTGYKFVSFDLFDTLIERVNLSAFEIQKLSSENVIGKLRTVLSLELESSEFLELRQAITAKLKRYSGEPSLESVLLGCFEVLKVPYRVAHEIMIDSAEFEYQLESESLVVVDGAIPVLRRLRSQGVTIVVISDMYFSESRISEILDSCGLSSFIDKLYVSSSFGVTKQSGELFDLVLKDLQISAELLLHIGDNFESDICLAKDRGIETVWIKLQQQEKTNLPSLHTLDRSEKIALLSLTFVCQVLRQARRLGASKLYFLSRDGIIFHDLLKLAQRSSFLVSQMADEIEIRELAISRASSLFLGLQDDGNTLEKIFKLFLQVRPSGFHLVDLVEFLKIEDKVTSEINFRVDSEASCVLYADLIWSRDPSLAKCVIDASIEQGQMVKKYLIQERVLASNQCIGLVDIGYRSTTVNKIASFVKVGRDNEVKNLNLISLLLCEGREFCSASNLYPDIVTAPKPLLRFKTFSTFHQMNFSWLEIFYQTSGLGPLFGYELQEGTRHIQASFAPLQNGCQRKDDFLSACEKILARLSSLSILLGPRRALKLAESIAAELQKPNLDEVRRISKRKFSRGWLDQDSVSIINSDLTLSQCFRPRVIRSLAANDVWIVGSLIASDLGSKRNCLEIFYSALMRMRSLHVSKNRSAPIDKSA